MLHPSYLELMNAVNANAEAAGEDMAVTSRYSIVVAAAKRARQLIEEEVQEADNYVISKPLSTAISELMSGKVRFVPGDDDYSDYTESAVMQSSFGASVSIDSDSEEAEDGEEEDEYRSGEEYDAEEDSFEETFDDEEALEEREEDF